MNDIEKRLADLFSETQGPANSTWPPDRYAELLGLLQLATADEIARATVAYYRSHLAATMQAQKAIAAAIALSITSIKERHTMSPIDKDTEALQVLIKSALEMLKVGFAFARRDDSEAYASLTEILHAGAVPQLTLTLGDKVTCRGLLVNSDEQPLVQVFEMHADKIKPQQH